MKSKLENMDYSDYIDHLNTKGIEYIEDKYIDDYLAFEEVIEVTPISNQLKSRKFSTDGGWQMLENKSIYKFDRFDYSEFISYLNTNNIQYDETNRYDSFHGFYIGVKPKNKKFKQRHFCCSFYKQVFGENDWYNYS